MFAKSLKLFVITLFALFATIASAQGTAVYDSIPSPQPPNVASLGFQATSTSEFGDEILLEADTPRSLGYATVLMSSWSLHSNYLDLPVAGYPHPITLNIYTSQASAEAHTPAMTVTQSFVIPWRPTADTDCGTAWKGSDGNCYNGFAFTITFDLRSKNFNLPEKFIYGIAYNTNTWGYDPLGPGPYESLNVGLSDTSVTVGTDVNTDAVYWNTHYAGFYADGGRGGVDTFRLDTNWAPYTPAVQFTTYGFPTSTESCKNGAWKNLVRSNYTPFKNQGACVSYVNTGK